MGLMALVGLASAGFAFGGGFSAAASIGAPITSYRQASAFARGYGDGMLPGMMKQALTQRYIDAYFKDYDRYVYTERKFYESLLNQKLKSYESSYTVSQPRYNLII
jgi:hypothetical protein